jgi:carbon starvation protein
VNSATDAAETANARKALRANRAEHLNQLINTAVAGTFLILVALILLLSIREWLLLLARRKLAVLHETAPVWLPASALVPSPPLNAMGLIAISLLLVRELSGEAALARAQVQAELCDCAAAQTLSGRQNTYLTSTTHRFTGINRCC